MPFEFVVELTDQGAAFSSSEGTTWQAFSWSCAKDGPCMFFVGRNGIRSRQDDLQPDGYCLAVEATAGSVSLKAMRLTNWVALGYSCGEAEPCRFAVTENGVRGL